MKMKKKWNWALGGVILFHLGINLAWLLTDKTPPAWDQAAHIRSVILAISPMGFFEKIRSFGGYPPLIYGLGAVWVKMMGVGVDRIVFLNSVFFGIIAVG